MPQAFVTGGSGFVGRNLIAELVRRGYGVRALARSAAAQAEVHKAGAVPVAGDLFDHEALLGGMQGVDVVFHAAANTDEWAPYEAFERVNVQGTRQVIEASRAAAVKRLVHFSTEAVLLDGRPLIDVDETVPIPDRPIGHYAATKALAEKAVRAAQGVQTVVVRPRLIWGRGDTSLLPKLVAAVRQGRFAWIDGGAALTSTCHVGNACDGAIRAAESGRPGGVYFLTDGPPIRTREFLTAMLATQGVDAGTKSVPKSIALFVAWIAEAVWTALKLKGVPPASRTAILLMGQQMTVSDALARRELGYGGVISREDGLAEMGTASKSL